MIAPLRRHHRLLTTTLAVALPILYVVALKARPETPRMPSLPTALVGAPPDTTATIIAEIPFPEAPLLARLRRRASDTTAGDTTAGETTLELVPGRPLGSPDVLVYWVAVSAAAEGGGGVPPGAHLLGSFDDTRPRTLALPFPTLAGDLLLYSLGHQEVVARVALPAPAELGAEGEP